MRRANAPSIRDSVAVDLTCLSGQSPRRPHKSAHLGALDFVVRCLIAAILIFAIQEPALAFCGFYAGKADASLFNQASQVVLVRDGKRTVISMQNDYSGPLKEFALIVPTPTVIAEGQVHIADKALFERLDAYSSPRLAEYYDADPCQLSFHWGDPVRRQPMYERMMAPPAPMAMPSAFSSPTLGVTVEAQYSLEEYDIVSLSATQSDGLETWLHENGYTIPAGASTALKPYINLGMKFFVAKVNLEAQKKTGYTNLRPLQFAYESEKFMLPLRLGMLNAPPDKAQDLIVYMLTKNGRVESSNYRTVKLPANVNLPYFTKPKFDGFYKAMFDKQAELEHNRVVFTEYFWNMAWCDPCAGQPLSHEELQKAGVFWIDGDAESTFKMMTTPANTGAKRPLPARYGPDPVQLTRLHVRYTPATFPEDLMFTQTQDHENWQARYVIQNPYQGTPAQCSSTLAQTSCEELCRPRVERIASDKTGESRKDSPTDSLDALVLTRDCVTQCVSAKQDALAKATRYYQSDLPARISKEKETLASLTGWTLRDIDAMPNARQYVSSAGKFSSPTAEADFLSRLFGTRAPQ